MIPNKIRELLSSRLDVVFDTAPTALIIYVDPKRQWQLKDLEIAYANQVAKDLLPIESSGDWSALSDSAINTLQGVRLTAKNAQEHGGRGFLGPFQYSTLNSNGESIHIEFQGMILGDTSSGRISLVSAKDVTDRIFRERINAGKYGVSDVSIHRLSDRERSIAFLVVEGLSTKEIANELCISERTVENHRQRIRTKLNLTNRKISISECLANF